jgi:predicted pyridoxine 5'-phosphate oxidase superfamily flavin-nucleotide-binding protein
MAARPQAFAELDEDLRLFIERQEMMFVATFDDDGERTCTFRTGPPGFVRVLDINRLAWPEYADDVDLDAISANPLVSLLFLNYQRDAIGLHIDGRAKVLDDRSMRRAYRCLPEPVHGAAPAHWVTVYVEEVHSEGQ